jgi:hypothetical protein
LSFQSPTATLELDLHTWDVGFQLYGRSFLSAGFGFGFQVGKATLSTGSIDKEPIQVSAQTELDVIAGYGTASVSGDLPLEKLMNLKEGGPFSADVAGGFSAGFGAGAGVSATGCIAFNLSESARRIFAP